VGQHQMLTHSAANVCDWSARGQSRLVEVHGQIASVICMASHYTAESWSGGDLANTAGLWPIVSGQLAILTAVHKPQVVHDVPSSQPAATDDVIAALFAARRIVCTW